MATDTAEFYAVFAGDTMISGPHREAPANLVVRKVRATCTWTRERYEARPGVISERIVPITTHVVIEEIERT